MTYVGYQFPTALGGQADKDYAVLWIDKDEDDAEWHLGFYRLGIDLMELNRRLNTSDK
ncbi:MAG TPA: hypothetical protein VOA64_10910 [Candidatus Dormibacteraeota bacterium]|nr:hypothetical protein [Candidatus Dormibacteraeota bacterium]